MTSIDYAHAVVLSGGGAKGAYEVGVMKALFEGRCPSTNGRPLNPGVFSGTSAGSFNAAVMVSRSRESASARVHRLESIWRERIADRHFDGSNAVFRVRGLPSGLLNPLSLLRDPLLPLQQWTQDASYLAGDSWRRVAGFRRSGGGLPRSLLDLMNLSSFLSFEPFHQLLRDTIRADEILTSKRALRVATTNWRTGKLRIYRNPCGDGDSGQVAMNEKTASPAIAASAAIPGIFPPVVIDGEPFVDGGAVMNTPLRPGILAGADTHHVIYLDPALEDVQLGPVESSLQSSGRVFSMMLAVITNRDIAAARRINRMLALETRGRSSEGRTFKKLTIHRYRPQHDLGGILGMLDFTPTNLTELIALGEDDAVHHNCAASECVI